VIVFVLKEATLRPTDDTMIPGLQTTKKHIRQTGKERRQKGKIRLYIAVNEYITPILSHS
jgi:hypothetical protein